MHMTHLPGKNAGPSAIMHHEHLGGRGSLIIYDQHDMHHERRVYIFYSIGIMGWGVWWGVAPPSMDAHSRKKCRILCYAS